MRPVVLIIRDGWGVNDRADGNSAAAAKTPVIDAIRAEYPHCLLDCCGEAVGLPDGYQGSSEVGHLNMGGHRGDISIFGLAEGKYKLVETKAPDGYVLPSAPFEIEIVDAIGELGSVATLNVTGSHKEDDAGSIVNTNGIAEGVLTVWAEITNKPGSALPETGGMGTTIFTVIGIVMMVGAAAFFTSRKRSSVA